MSDLPNVTIALTRYMEPVEIVRPCIEALAAQEGVRAEILFYDQYNDNAMRALLFANNSDLITFTYKHINPEPVAVVRNQLLEDAQTDIILFTDPDVIPDKNWAAGLAWMLTRDGVVLAGSRIKPEWLGAPPWIARADFVKEQYSLIDFGVGNGEVDRLFCASMGVRRDRLGFLRFPEHLGRRGGKLLGGEDTALCQDVRTEGGKIMYCGDVLVKHQIPVERCSWSWLWRRFYYAGISRAMRGGKPSPMHKIEDEDRLALAMIAPFYALGYLVGKMSAKKEGAKKKVTT